MMIPGFLVEHVKEAEGWRAKAYMDANDGITIGWGHLVKPGEPYTKDSVITPAEGERLLMADIAEAQRAALSLSPNLANAGPKRLAAITDFVFNVGDGVAGYRGSTLRRMVNHYLWEEAAHQMARWVYDDGKVMPGLVKRRAVTARWLAEGDATLTPAA